MTRRVALLLPLLLLAGCAQKINSSDLESKLKDQLAKSGGVTLTAVDCPDDIEVAKGKKFSCTATVASGEKLRVEVTLTDDKGGFRAVVPPQ